MRCAFSTLAFLLAGSFLLEANPTGGDVAAGSASIAGQGSSTVTINQASHTAIINWSTFSIGSGELTKFIQPSSTSATLNRVLGGQTSFINGTLSANGQVFLINGNGIVVGANGIITTAGFTASTRDIADADFTSGNLHFLGGGDAGVKNLGTITALGGNVVLIGKTVDNKGTINATGTAGLVAGDDVLLAQKNDDGSTITVNPVSAPSAAAGKVGVRNSGTIAASSAELKAANGNIYALAIQNDGLVRATTVTQQGGHIFLTADSGTIVNSGTLDASATAAKGKGGAILVKSKTGKVSHTGKILARGGQGGAGGNVEISGAQVALTGTVDTRAEDGATGNLLLDPATINVITGGGTDPSGSTIDPGTVDSLLNSTGLTLSASNNITISNDISWDSGNNLALVTTTAGSTIDINAAITNSHATTGGLILDAAAATDVISTSINGRINVANFILQRGAWKQLINVGGNGGNIPQTLVNGTETNVLPAFTATNDFEIDNGTFLRADSGNGSTVYYGLEDVYGLQGVNGFLTSNFTLNSRIIDASGTSTWNSGEGFLPIGSESTPYQGRFDYGTIESVTINQPDSTNVGIFGVAGADADIYGIAIEYGSVTGGTNVGGLVGENYGMVDSCSDYGGGQVTGSMVAGGLVGLNTASGTVQYGYDYSNVSGRMNVGGVVGENDGLIYSVQDYATVTAASDDVEGSDWNVGGLTGLNSSTGTITLSTFSGTVQMTDVEARNVGGLAGENDGIINSSHTFPGASVTGDANVGGLAGYNTGFIYDSYNSASVTGRNNYFFDGEGDGGSNVGGIAGQNSYSEDFSNQPVFTPAATIQTSYNTGVIDGVSDVGGIAGLNSSSSTVNTCYNVGAIGDAGTLDAGGIVGENAGQITTTYSSGLVLGTKAGGLVGFDDDGATTENSYWDISTSGQQAPTNANIDGDEATETNLASVDSSTDGTAYTISGNDPESGSGYGFFGAATLVSGTNGVYQIGTSPDSGGGAAWYIIDGETRPMLGMEQNGNINSPHELQLIAANLSGGYDINSELDMSVINNPAEIWNSSGFVPIGADPNNEGVAFTGSVYGNNEYVSNLYINRPETNDVGLFGYVGSGGFISDVIMENSSITGNSNVGGIVGDNQGSVTYSQNNDDEEFSESFENEDEEGSSVYGNGNNIGGIVGLNESGGEVSRDINTGVVQGNEGSSGVGGIAGTNNGNVEQDINSGAVGSGSETAVGGLVGFNGSTGLVDNSYGDDNGYVAGSTYVGGLVGDNYGALETSYNTSSVSGGDSDSTGTLVGVNESSGQVSHVYAQDAEGQVAVGSDMGTPTDVIVYTRDQLTDMSNFAQGDSPGLWDFLPQNGEGGGVWGVNLYNYNGQIHDGLPVLQWQYPVNAEVAVVGGTQNYGYAPTVTETGNGASQLPTQLPNGLTFGVTGGNQAGDTQQITVSGTPTGYLFNVEYVNGAVNLVPAPLDIVANPITVASGQSIPPYSVTYTGFQNDDTASNLDGTLTFTIDPQPDTATGQHTLTPSGLTSSNYDITYFSGILNVTTSNPTPGQIATTFTAEVASLQNQFGNDPFNGLDPNFFMTIPNQVTLAGDLFGAINNEPKKTDYAYASSTANLPAFSRLVTSSSGVVEIIDGVVVVGDPSTGKPIFLNQPGSALSQDALTGLHGVLSPAVYNELIALIHAQ